MSFETVSLLLNWLQMGALLAILFRLASTHELIASTQRELRRAIHHLGSAAPLNQALTTLSASGVSRWALAPRRRVWMLRARSHPTIWLVYRLGSILKHLPGRSSPGRGSGQGANSRASVRA
jgi:hypothetical protein